MRPDFLYTTNLVWLPGERAEAYCNAIMHDESARIPVEHCSCGIYAFNAPYKIRQDGYLNQDLLGEVYLWGKVIEHTMGFKAEYAYPKAFYLLRRQREFVTPRWEKFKKRCEYIAYRYDVPFTVVEENHPIYEKTPEELAEEAHRRAIEAAERMRQSLGTRAYNQKMKEAAMALPSKFPHLYKSLWAEIEANVEIQVQAKLKGKKR